ncbi:hypothetical protein COW94_03520 [Candidatus Peregrinibacteria bacterium CG22_combo_CG10-13_8_21_14_all_44_10]|nr:MAG: hypothetical protein AUK45_04975 [Candidatus Peregrinibacteria bacterium CG2_30_44_17]PIP66127.1 MAG: hypothetical protein COW94_03520 [Candidatus Peregrinibacteria bacterium CG22_combo_CG10-13_8_21_14_all_44_10]PIX80429.1 MAG: hypothetical protein COZ35_00795 [Candidatus Peregrinibacteria bacterium CG_4_10_14_3_um_filter_44_21]
MLPSFHLSHLIESGRFCFRESGQLISAIASASDEISTRIKQQKPGAISVLRNVKDKRMALWNAAKSAGLRVKEVDDIAFLVKNDAIVIPLTDTISLLQNGEDDTESSGSQHVAKQALEDRLQRRVEQIKQEAVFNSRRLDYLQETDDGGHEVQMNFKIEVATVEEAQRAIRFCIDNRLMALPIGSKTSALGVFQVMDLAKQKGLNGVVGIQVADFNPSMDDRTPEVSPCDQFLTIPEFDNSVYDLVKHPSLPVAILKSKTFPQDKSHPHRVVAHAGAKVADVRTFLNQVCPHDKYRFSLMSEPTSEKEAHIGGIISTGAEGGNRSKPSDDILSATIVNGDAQVSCLSLEESRKIVGLNGSGGLVMQAEFEATALPKHEYSLFIPVPGKNEREAWTNMLRLQKLLSKYAEVRDPGRVLEGNNDDGLLVTGIEPLSKNVYEMALSKFQGDEQRALEEVSNHYKQNPYGLYVTFSSFGGEGRLDELLSVETLTSLLSEICQCETDDIYDHLEELTILNPDRQAGIMNRLRHGAPTASREKAKDLGGVTASSDLNIRFTSGDSEQDELARQEVANLFADYIDGFDSADGMNVAVYGHLHPGIGIGGGIDPHIRIIFELSDPGSRYNAPEQVLAMKAKQKQLYRKLLALHGNYGIEIMCPEKSRFTNAEYWNWLILNDPDQAAEYVDSVQRNGYSHNEDGTPAMAILGARVPHEMAGKVVRTPGGVKALLNGDRVTSDKENIVDAHWDAILDFAELPVGSPEVKRLVADTLATIHAKFGLTDRQYPLFLDHPDDCEVILRGNFGDYESAGYKINQVEAANIEVMDFSKADPNTFYVVKLDGLGIPPGLSIMIAPHNAVKAAYDGMVAGSNKASYGNLYTMWSKWPYECDDVPNVPAIAALALILQKDDPGCQAYGEARDIHIADSTGVNISKVIRGIDRSSEMSAPDQQAATSALQTKIGVPHKFAMGFESSRLKCIGMLAEAIAARTDSVNLLQVVNDTGSDAAFKVFRSAGISVKKVQTPWTTTEHSEMDHVISRLCDQMEEGKTNVVFVTPHKDSTTADFLPDHLVEALKGRGKVMGRDYYLVCDVDNATMARDYATTDVVDEAFKRVPFNGMIGALRSSASQPMPFAFIGLTPTLSRALGLAEEAHVSRLKDSFERTEAGDVRNPLALKMVSEVVSQPQSVADIQSETAKKVKLVMGWLERHDDLIDLIPNRLDQSPLIIGVLSQAKNLSAAKRILAEVFGYYVQAGHGPYSKEAVSFDLSTLAYDHLQGLLTAFDVVLELEDVHGREHVPNVALREPHNPLSVIERLSKDITVDDIFKDRSGLQWLHRLVKTYNAGVATDSRVDIAGQCPDMSGGYAKKAKIYHHPDNLTEMQKILALQDDETGCSIGYFYGQYLFAEAGIRAKLLLKPDHRYQEGDVFSDEIEAYLVSAKAALAKVAYLLKRYVDGPNGNAAARDSEGRVKWPIVA